MTTYYIVTSLASVCIALITIVGLHGTQLTFNFKIEVQSNPTATFNCLRNPEILPYIDFSVKKVTIQNRVMEDSDETIYFTRLEEINHLGLVEVPYTLISDEDYLTVTLKSSWLNGLVQSEVLYKIEEQEDTNETSIGSTIQEQCTLIFPRVLKGYINKTISHIHPSILQNIKLLLSEKQLC